VPAEELFVHRLEAGRQARARGAVLRAVKRVTDAPALGEELRVV
jgi:hypothetical protein